MIVPVILSGGAGTRLWPLSRELYPKQLLPLVGRHTMLQETILRLAGLSAGAPIVVCNEAHRFLVAEQLRAISREPRAIVLEPHGRNTAPAIALAAHAALAADEGDSLLLVLPADHVIGDIGAFHRAIDTAAAAAREGALATFGVVPTAAETGYGYIRRGKLAGGAYRIAEFVEKPDESRARQFLAAGEYYWNSGMFLFRARHYLEELEKYAPDIASVCRTSFAAATRDLDFTRIDTRAFEACRSESIDYAVMEKTADAVVVPMDAGWSDVGSWASLHAACQRDAQGNTLCGDVFAEDTRGSYVYSESRLVATVGLTDHVVVETKDAVLVVPKSRVQDVKALVARLKAEGRYEHSLHREVFRPWGSYDSIDNGERFQVKRLVVRPGGVLSLQLHHHRAEHWVVVSGTARITRGEESFLLEENQSTYIPIGVRHRIENPGRIALHIIEVQSGSYLGEDDIVRLEDRYGRQGSSKN
ncbi:MAG TPA: mannose-1-phosphate guanylyltransferase/mannose-6-phosphate isomerase [Steroidobacteraceae bacterium]|jgi:mannose-1-phosphate guanylyltransferase/mannose-6-phosphate isomerase|nr:mannose-1-phosphate guanylyltransferase/mannose-6-phosphate isomerase [Steroidobacteraceae bacterium]